MYEPMETEIDRMKRIPIEEFLARLGHSPVQRRTNALWYKAPYREERTASFKVNMERNLCLYFWRKRGQGRGMGLPSLLRNIRSVFFHPPRQDCFMVFIVCCVCRRRGRSLPKKG